MSETESVILFADIHRSTALFENLGDEAAARLVGHALETATRIAAEHGGRMIRTKGDDILCAFASAEGALRTAQQIHAAASRDADMKRQSLSFRIGINQGPVIFADDTIYGDSVNMGARLVAEAKSRQTLISDSLADTASQLFPDQVRPLGEFSLRGRSGGFGVHELIAPATTEEITEVGQMDFHAARDFLLVLRFHEQQNRLNPLLTRFVIGRGKDCDLVVNHSTVSREHAEIRFSDGRFILTDFSTNGSFVVIGGRPRLVHRSSQALRGRGTIYVGRTLNDPLSTIYFDCVGSRRINRQPPGGQPNS